MTFNSFFTFFRTQRKEATKGNSYTNPKERRTPAHNVCIQGGKAAPWNPAHLKGPKLTPDVALQVRGRYRRTFEIFRGGGVEFQFSYWFKGAIAAHIDPTYDRLEEESDDFFLYVMAMWEYWKNRSADEFEALAREAHLLP